MKAYSPSLGVCIGKRDVDGALPFADISVVPETTCSQCGSAEIAIWLYLQTTAEIKYWCYGCLAWVHDNAPTKEK